jgi:hypothetical protein
MEHQHIGKDVLSLIAKRKLLLSRCNPVYFGLVAEVSLSGMNKDPLYVNDTS